MVHMYCVVDLLTFMPFIHRDHRVYSPRLSRGLRGVRTRLARGIRKRTIGYFTLCLKHELEHNIFHILLSQPIGSIWDNAIVNVNSNIS